MMLAAGQRWRYPAPMGFEASRIVIGALATTPGGSRIVCFSVLDAPYRLPDETIGRCTIPFVPLSEEAYCATVTAEDGVAAPAEGFAEALELWRADERGLTHFTVPFDGFLDRLVARQMALIVGAPVS